MRSFATALASFLAFGLTPAMAESGNTAKQTTADMVLMCSQEDKMFCYGFLSGTGQFYELLVEDDRDGANVDPFVCPGREVSRDEAIGVFVAWAAANPDLAGIPAVDGVLRSWNEAFPCE